MAKPIPLPNVQDLPRVVIFHRNHPSSQCLLMHIPTGPESAETYPIQLDQKSPPAGEYDPRHDHKGWIKRLPNSQGLMDRLSYEMHVSYYPHDGGCVMPLEDPDAIPWIRQALALARREGYGVFDQYFNRRRAYNRTLPRPNLQRMLAMSPLRRSSW